MMKRQMFYSIWKHVLFKVNKKPLPTVSLLHWHCRTDYQTLCLESTHPEHNTGQWTIRYQSD